MNISDGYKFAKKLFRHSPLLGGVHATPMSTILDVMKLIDVNTGDKCWDIGCGELRLACALSSAAKNVHVVCTDLSTRKINSESPLFYILLLIYRYSKFVLFRRPQYCRFY